LFGGGIGKVNEEESMVGGEFVFPIDPVPHDMIVRPSLEKDKERLAVGFSINIVKKGLWFFGHPRKDIIIA
jgi:hypothetical protein